MCSMYLWVLRVFFLNTLPHFSFFLSVWWPTDLGWSSICLRCSEGCCFESDFWNSHSALGQALDQAPAWEHSKAQYIQIFSPSLQNNEVTVITSIDFLWVSKALKAEHISSTPELLFWAVIKDLQSASGYCVLPDRLPATLGESLGLSSHCTSSCHCPHRLPLFVFVSLSHFFWLPQSFCFAPGTATAFSILQPHTTLKPSHAAQLSISRLSTVSLCPCLLFLV